MMRFARRAFLTGLVATVIACTNAGEDETDYTLFQNSWREAFSARNTEAPELIITEERLNNTKEPVLMIDVEDIGRATLLRQLTKVNDPFPGTVVVWRASDGAQVMLRDGVLISTRGVGGDVVESNVSEVRSLIASGRFGPSNRSVSFLSGDNQLLTLNLSCSVTNRGLEGVVLVEKPVSLQRIREECPTEYGPIVYDYWIEPGAQVIRKSRQWAGPVIGYYVITLLKG